MKNPFKKNNARYKIAEALFKATKNKMILKPGLYMNIANKLSVSPFYVQQTKHTLSSKYNVKFPKFITGRGYKKKMTKVQKVIKQDSNSVFIQLYKDHHIDKHVLLALLEID